MAYSHVAYTGDGTNAIFNIPFPFLKREFITVNINGIQQPPEDVEWLTDASIRLVKAPPAGSSVLIFRDTAKDKAVVDFRDGSVLTERALDDQVAQLLHITQEVYDVPGQLQSTLEGIESVAQEAANQARLAQEEADRARTEADRATDMANIGPAKVGKLGMVKIGEGIDVEEDGTISVTPINFATRDYAGIVQIGQGLNITDASVIPGEEEEDGEGSPAPAPGILSVGTHRSEDPAQYGKGDFQFYGHVKLTDNFEEETSAKDGVGISAAGVKAAWDRLVGASTGTVITTSGDYVVPETGVYKITCIGGGGNGGKGGTGGFGGELLDGSKANYKLHSGGAGGGGGAGALVEQTVELTKDSIIPVTIGASGGGTTTFGSYVSASGGGNGGNGSNAYNTSPSNMCSNFNNFKEGYPGTGGAAGISYGSASLAGANGASSGWSRDAFSIGDSAGGNGGRTTDALYGHGGKGGNGGGGSKPQGCSGTVRGGASGEVGTQGCVKIQLSLGG